MNCLVSPLRLVRVCSRGGLILSYAHFSDGTLDLVFARQIAKVGVLMFDVFLNISMMLCVLC